MGAVMALVVFVSLFNTMTMSVTERTVKLAPVGLHSSEIVAGFLKEAGLLALIGSAIGALVSA